MGLEWQCPFFLSWTRWDNPDLDFPGGSRNDMVVWPETLILLWTHCATFLLAERERSRTRFLINGPSRTGRRNAANYLDGRPLSAEDKAAVLSSSADANITPLTSGELYYKWLRWILGVVTVVIIIIIIIIPPLSSSSSGLEWTLSHRRYWNRCL